MAIIGLDADLEQPSALTRLCEKRRSEPLGSPRLLDSLTELGQRCPTPPVLYLSADLAVLLVARHQRELAPLYRFRLPSPEVTELLMDKTRFATYAIERGFPVPRTFTIQKSADLDAAADRVTYPSVLKPGYRTTTWLAQGFPKGFVVDDAKTLRRLYAEVRDIQDSFVLQEWIPGEDSQIHFCLVYFDERSRCLASFCGRKLRQWPPSAGNTSIAESAPCPDVERETIRLFESLDFRGFGSVEFKRDPRTGRFVIIEPTVGRANLQSETATANGVNLAWTAYAHLCGLDRPGPTRSPRSTTRWINEYADLKACVLARRERRLTIADWVRSYRGARYYAWFSWKDPVPALAMGWRLTRRALRGDIGSIASSAASRRSHASASQVSSRC